MKNCPTCKSSNLKKNGFVSGKQRYACKDCSYQFTRMSPKGKAKRWKKFAIKMYLEGVGLRSLGRAIGVSATTILRWVKSAASVLPLPEQPSTVSVLNIDEMWTFVQSKKTCLDQLYTRCNHWTNPIRSGW